MEANMNKFLASVLSKTEIDDDQAYTIQQILFPAKDETPSAALKAAREMSIAYDKFNIKYEAEKAKRAEAKKDVKPLNAEEIDELVEMGL